MFKLFASPSSDLSDPDDSTVSNKENRENNSVNSTDYQPDSSTQINQSHTTPTTSNITKATVALSNSTINNNSSTNTTAVTTATSDSTVTTNMSLSKADELKEIEKAITAGNQPKMKHILERTNYRQWQANLESTLFFHKLNILLLDLPAEDQALDSYKRLNTITYNLIMEYISDSLKLKFKCYTRVKELIQKIKDHFEGNNQTKAIQIFNKLVNLIQNKPDDLEYSVTQFREIMTDFDKTIGDDKDAMWRAFFIQILSPKHNQVRSLLLSNREYRVENYLELCIEEQLAYRAGRSINRTHQVNNMQHSSSSSGQRFRETDGNSVRQIKCFECDQNHRMNDCSTYKQKRRENRNYKPKGLLEFYERRSAEIRSANMDVANSSNDSTGIACALLCNLKADFDGSKFYLDSGATAHIFNSTQDCKNVRTSNKALITATGDRYQIESIVDKDLKTSGV